MDKKYFIILCTVPSNHDIHKTETYIESFYDISDYERLVTQRALTGDETVCDFSRYISANSIRQRLNTHRRYSNVVITVDGTVSEEFDKQIRASETNEHLIDLIIKRGKGVQI